VTDFGLSPGLSRHALRGVTFELKLNVIKLSNGRAGVSRRTG
jgi:hypothetical protein